tara:strand:- start:2939 stop:3505 length:567 start_codon:yes stop_codon:yes gene_type:complete
MIDPIFSKPIYIENIEYDKNLVLNEIKKINFKKISSSDYMPTASSISESLNVLDNINFQNLKNKILTQFQLYVYDTLKYNNYKFKIKNSWFTKTLLNEKSEIHNHRNSLFSGVLYIQTKPKKGSICFIDNSKSGYFLEPSECNILNSEEWIINLSEGDIIFFPSSLHHKLMINNTNIERISLAMDFTI